MAEIPNQPDPTLEAMYKASIESYEPQTRDYIGASLIGHECSRYIYYKYNGFLEAKPDNTLGIYAAECGHHVEDVTAARLRQIKGVELWTHDETGKQYGWSAMDGKLKGHYDGVIKGILQAPKSPHIWEAKDKNDKKFSEFQKMKMKFGEKYTLANWDNQYYVQGQLNMHFSQIDRLYMTVSYAGGRKYDSCRTDYDPVIAERYINRADAILQLRSAPPRVSENPDWYKCKYMCGYKDICHGVK